MAVEIPCLVEVMTLLLFPLLGTQKIFSQMSECRVLIHYQQFIYFSAVGHCVTKVQSNRKINLISLFNFTFNPISVLIATDHLESFRPLING